MKFYFYEDTSYKNYAGYEKAFLTVLNRTTEKPYRIEFSSIESLSSETFCWEVRQRYLIGEILDREVSLESLLTYSRKNVRELALYLLNDLTQLDRIYEITLNRIIVFTPKENNYA